MDLLAWRLPRVSRHRRAVAGDRHDESALRPAQGGQRWPSWDSPHLVGGVPAGAVPQQPPTVTFRAGADVVAVEAAVRRDKRPVTGLKTGDFELLDNGVPQQISDLSYERLPIDVTVVLDVSASVTGPVLDQLRQSVRQLKADLGPRDRLKLVAFNMQVRRLADFEAPAAATDTAFASLSGRGSSAVFDSVAVQLAAPMLEGRRHLIVLFTDGQDSSSISDRRRALRRRETDELRRSRSCWRRPRRSAAARRHSRRSPGQPPITVGRMYRSARQGNRRRGRADDAPVKRLVDLPPHAVGLPRELCVVLHAAGSRARRLAHDRRPREAGRHRGAGAAWVYLEIAASSFPLPASLSGFPATSSSSTRRRCTCRTSPGCAA